MFKTYPAVLFHMDETDPGWDVTPPVSPSTKPTGGAKHYLEDADGDKFYFRTVKGAMAFAQFRGFTVINEKDMVALRAIIKERRERKQNGKKKTNP